MTSAIVDRSIEFRVRGLVGRAVVGALMLALAVPSVARAHLAPAPGRAEVHRMLAPMAVFTKSVAPTAGAVLQAATATQAADNPCMQQARSGISATRAAGKLSASDASTANDFVGALAGIDVLQVVLKPLDAPLSVARRSYRTMRLTDPVLRAGARAKATQLSALLRLERGADVDFCGLMTRLADVGFNPDVALSIEVLDVLAPLIDIADPNVDRAMTRAERRMRGLGAGPTSVRRFDDFPFSALPPAVAKVLSASLGDL